MALTDIPKLTLKEIAKFEELSGTTWESFWTGDPERVTAKALAACAFIVKRRQLVNDGLPVANWTWNEAMGLTMDEARAIVFGEAEDIEEALADKVDDEDDPADGEAEEEPGVPLDPTDSSF